jgi:hypothetical protein
MAALVVCRGVVRTGPNIWARSRGPRPVFSAINRIRARTRLRRRTEGDIRQLDCLDQPSYRRGLRHYKERERGRPAGALGIGKAAVGSIAVGLQHASIALQQRRGVIATAPRRVAVHHRRRCPRLATAPDVSLGIGATGSHVPYKSLIRLRAAYVPDAAWAVFRTAPELIPGTRRPPGFDIAYGISTLHQRFACARLSGSHLTGSCPAFCCNAHHHRS